MTSVEIVFSMTRSEYALLIHRYTDPRLCVDCGDIGDHTKKCRTCGAWTLHKLKDALSSGLIELVDRKSSTSHI